MQRSSTKNKAEQGGAPNPNTSGRHGSRSRSARWQKSRHRIIPEFVVFGRSLRLWQITFAAAVFAIHGCSPFDTEKSTEKVTLPGGEVITNESYLSLGRDIVRHNKLFFQQDDSSPRELLGEIIEEHGPQFHSSAPQSL